MKNIVSFLLTSAEKFPENTYVVDKGRTWTYGEVYEKVKSFAKYLLDCKTNAGDKIILYLDNSVEYIIAFFAVLMVDGVIVPINKNMNYESIEFIISETEPKAFISSSVSFNRLNGKIAFTAIPNISSTWKFMK